MKESWYVVLYDGKGDKCGGYSCHDAIDGLTKLGHQHNIFTSAACFCLKLDNDNPALPVRQWSLQID